MLGFVLFPTEPGLLQNSNNHNHFITLLVLFEYQVLFLFHLLYLYNQPLRLGGGSGQDLQKRRKEGQN